MFFPFKLVIGAILMMSRFSKFLLLLHLLLQFGAAIPPRLNKTENPLLYKGHDLSSLKILEDGGAIYHDTAKYNATRAAEDILGDGGMNTVRLR
jgi:arabinogalactan endo-1,4-beta-galactosidase